MTQDTEDVAARVRNEITALLSNGAAKNGRERFNYATAAEADAAISANEAAFKLLPSVMEALETDRLIIDTLEASGRQSLSDRIDVLRVDDVAEILWLYAREKMRLAPKRLPVERQDFRDKARSIIKTRAALHQEGIAP